MNGDILCLHYPKPEVQKKKIVCFFFYQNVALALFILSLSFFSSLLLDVDCRCFFSFFGGHFFLERTKGCLYG